MNFARQIKYNRRLLVEDIFRRLEAALQPVVDALNDFFAVLFSRRLPPNWREQWHALIAEQEAAGYRVSPQSVREFEDWIEAWARYCELLPIAETQAVSAAPEANDLLVPKLTTTQTVPRYRNGRIVGGMGGDVSAGQSLSVALPILFEVTAAVGGVFFEPLDWALTAREIWNDPTSGWSYAGLIPFIPAGAGKAGKALGRVGDEVSEVAEAAFKNVPSSIGGSDVRGGAYTLRDPETGQVMRTGRSGDLPGRRGDHARDPLLKGYDFEPTYRTDVYDEQRGLEQFLHDTFNPPLNKINPISPRNPDRRIYLDAAEEFLRQQGGR